MPASRVLNLFERLGLGLLGLILPLVFFRSAEDAYRLPQLIALSLAVICLLLSWNAALRPSLALILGLAFFCWRVLTHLISGPRPDWLLEQGLYAALFIWGLAHLGDASKARRLKAAMLAGATIAALYALAQSYGFDPFGAGRTEQGFGARAHSTLGNPDFWGGYLILVLPFAFETPWLLALFVVALVLSQTRAAWLGFAAGGVLMFWKGPRRRALLAAGMGLGAFAVTAVPNPMNPMGLRSLERLKLSDAAGARFAMADMALSIAVKHPLLGAGDFTRAFLKEQGSRSGTYRFTHDAHNDWLQLAAESGFPALILFAALFGACLRSAWRSKHWALAALLLSFALNALLHFPLAIIPSAAIAWLALGWAAAEMGGKLDLRIFALLPLAAAFVFMRQLEASALLNKGMNLSLSSQADAGDKMLNASVKINANDERPWMRLGLNADVRGDLAAAEAAFSHCLWLPEGLSNLALVQAKAGKLEDAKANCLRALELNARSLDALGNLGKIEYLRGDVRAAEAVYLRGLAIDPEWGQGRFNLAAIYTNTGRKADAARMQKNSK